MDDWIPNLEAFVWNETNYVYGTKKYRQDEGYNTSEKH